MIFSFVNFLYLPISWFNKIVSDYEFSLSYDPIKNINLIINSTVQRHREYAV